MTRAFFAAPGFRVPETRVCHSLPHGGAWIATSAAITTPDMPESRFMRDRAVHLSVEHDDNRHGRRRLLGLRVNATTWRVWHSETAFDGLAAARSHA